MNEAVGEATITVDCADAESAKAVAAALTPDNDDYAHVEVDGTTVRVTVPETRLATLVRTVDDVLAGLTVAVDAVRAR